MPGKTRTGFRRRSPQTTMGCSLPPEILDLIVDHLCDYQITLKACCVVSKSWIPRTRKHLFARIKFHTTKPHVRRWKKLFPDPSNSGSPAHHTRSLTFCGLPVVTKKSGVGGWIRAFRNVVHLHLEFLTWKDGRRSLVPFHGLLPTVRSLRLSSTPFEIFDLVCSFPLLEDLALNNLLHGNDTDEWAAPSTSPKLTGFLDLDVIGGIRLATRRLLDLPDGPHFAKIAVSCVDGDLGLVTELVSRCSGTLECLRVHYGKLTHSSLSFCDRPLSHLLLVDPGKPRTALLDLSVATKLRDLAFQCTGANVRWVTIALQTVESKDLQRITLWPDISTSVDAVEGTVCEEWQNLDRLLVRFWTSHSIRPQVIHSPISGVKDISDHASSLLPELTRRGLVDIVRFYHSRRRLDSDRPEVRVWPYFL